jgi:hypothetical protein
MYIIAASFLGLFVLRIYVLSPFYPGPGPFEIYFDDRRSLVTVARVEPGSIAERAGLRAGDRIVSANGLTIRRQINWDMASLTFEVGRPLRLDIEREGRRFDLSVTPERRSQNVFRLPIVSLLSGADLLTLVLAFVVAFRRPQAPQVWQELFERTLAYDPTRRPQSAETLFSELQSALS